MTVIFVGISDPTCAGTSDPDCPYEHLDVHINKSVIVGADPGDNGFERYHPQLEDEDRSFEEYFKEEIASMKADGITPWYYRFKNSGQMKKFLRGNFNCGLLQAGGLENFKSYEI